MRVLVVSESFLPQINGVTNSVRRVMEHLSAEGHEAELVAPTGPDVYAGFRVRRARGANLPFYKDFRIGLETRRRLRAIMLQFRPDVVHIASPATLGYQAARAAGELGVPTVAIYQTDLVGFAERYDVPGGARAAAALTRKIHTQVDRTLAPSTASLAQLQELGVPGLARWGRGVDLRPSTPGTATGPASPAVPRGQAAGRVRRPAGRREGARAAHPPRPRRPVRAGARRCRPGGAAAARPAAARPLPGPAARRRPEPRLRLARRVRPHRAARDVLPVRAGGARLRRPRRRAGAGWSARRGVRRRDRSPLHPRRRRRTRGGRRPAGRATAPSANGSGRPPSAACRSGRGQRSTPS